MKFCSKCGKEIMDEAVVCPNCGCSAEKEVKTKEVFYICCSSYGRPRSATYASNQYKALLRNNGLPDIRFHDLRHTYASMLLREELSVKAVSNTLGHAK